MSKFVEMESRMSCPVCHEGIDVFAVGCCDHVICYKCSCRMRVLCEQLYCPICRTDLPQVYLIKEALKFSEIPRHGYIQNRRNKIFFQNEDIKHSFDNILENRCQICAHARPERCFKDLQNHLRKQHTLFYCNLCVDHLTLLPSERKFYNRHDLAAHRRQGDKDDKSYKGHPNCEFCDERYFDKDELYRHLRKDHYFCHFCDPEGCSEFYNDYQSLRNHFGEKHYLCQEGACSGVEVRLTHAFRSKIDFQAHTTAEHANNLTKAQAKQLRTIDIDYQLPRRETQRRRDRGAVNAGDYEDVRPVQTQVFHNNRGSRGRQRYEEPRGYRRGNFSEEDVQKAIHASLDVMKEKEKVEEQPEKEEEEKVLRNAENFPVLGNNDLRVDSPDDSDHKDSDSEVLDFSMAQQIALKNKRSVQYGRLISEEFPSLSGEPSTKDKTAETLEKKPVTVEISKPQPIIKSQPVSKSVSKPVSKFTNTTSKGPVVDDFPGLPTKSSSISSALGSAKWVPKQTPKETKQAAAMPVQITMNVSANNQKLSKNKTKLSNKTFQDEKDFPSLGGQPASTSASNMNWLQKSVKGKNKPIQEKQTIDWFDADNDFEYSIENVTKQSQPILTDDKKTNTSDTKKKKKKKDKSKSSDNDINIDTKSKGGSSLDSIASSLLSTKGVTNREPAKVESPKVVRKVETDRSASPENFKIVDKKVKTADIPEDNNKFSILSNETEIKPFVESKPRFVPKQNDKNLKLDDFPTLGSSNQSKAPPPGFAKPLPSNSSVSAAKPPGFDNVSSSKRPPPGFAMPTSSQKNGHSTSEEKSCTFTLKNIMPMMTEMSNFDYVAPENSKVRNQKLIADIMLHLGEDKENFDQFKTVSASFRQGTTDAAEYYKQCEKLIGKENFDIIFPELLVLLPDINKQQELLTTYKSIQEKNKSGHVIRISGKSGDAPWKQTSNFQTCPTCRQVLLSSDYTEHTSIHGSASDFPSLGDGGGGHCLRSWVKGK